MRQNGLECWMFRFWRGVVTSALAVRKRWIAFAGTGPKLHSQAPPSRKDASHEWHSVKSLDREFLARSDTLAAAVEKKDAWHYLR